MAKSHNLFYKSSLFIRSLSAAVAVLILSLIYYFLHNDGLFYLTLIVSYLVVHEYLSLNDKQMDRLTLYYLSFTSLGTILLFHFFNPIYLPAYLCLVYIGLIWQQKNKFNASDSYKMFSQIRIGIEATFYGVILTSFPVKILQLQNGDIYFLILLITVFSADTFAYFSGKLFGKKKLYPSISPNKTMAGLYGALIGSTLTGGTCFILLSKASPFFAFSTAMVVGFVSLNGDLFASLLKRSVDKKDSGKIMPGHGGLIDRLDGVIFASPIFYSIIRLMLENKILR